MNCYESQNEDEIKKNIFELSEEGLETLKNYLQQEADSFFAAE